MVTWSLVVELVRASVFAVAHLCGNSVGSGILAISVLVRVALLPLTIRAARRAMAHQAQLARLSPELERLRRAHAGDRAGLAAATVKLYRDHDIAPVPPGTLGAMLVQFPIGAALYQAFTKTFGARRSFLWIADLSRPDFLLAAAAAALAATASTIGTIGNSGSGGNGGRTAIVVSAAVTMIVAWRLTASVALYWVASNGVGVAQAIVLRRGAIAEKSA